MTPRTDSDALLPCPNPWCPSDSRRTIRWEIYSRQVVCTCGVMAPKSKSFIPASKAALAEAEAIAAWNTRADSPDIIALRKERDALKEAIKAADEAVTIEINPSNYDHDDVCLLNDQMVEAILMLRAAHATEGQS